MPRSCLYVSRLPLLPVTVPSTKKDTVKNFTTYSIYQKYFQNTATDRRRSHESRNWKEYSVQRPRLTGNTQTTYGIFIDCEAHFQSVSSHVLIEYITSCEIQYTTVILIFRDKPRIKNRSADLEQIYNKEVTSHLEFSHSHTCRFTLYLCVYILQLCTFNFPTRQTQE